MSRRRRRLLVAVAVIVVGPLLAHLGIDVWTHTPTPAGITLPDTPLTQASDDPNRREVGPSYARRRGNIHEVRLVGGPVAIGNAQVKLLRDEQIAIEGEMREQFAHYVPWSLARTTLIDLTRLRFRNLEDTLSPAYRNEIAAQAMAFQPDPFASMLDTYPRFVILHSLYDIMLSFEHSPLIGCSSVVLGPEATANGHTLLARNFDFEGPAILDEKKAVFLMREDEKIPYASVSWPGFVGSASGMNVEGLAIVIHGARAGEARTDGEPVAQTVRQLLGGARTTREALAQLDRRAPMVPHMLLLTDASGATAVVERVPGQPPFVRRRAAATTPLTNHFEGPAADDAKNLQVVAVTSTSARRRRLDEILSNLPPAADVQRAVDILRDKRAVGRRPLPLGDRSAIDGLIATHSVVMDTTARDLWVSEGPHATGRFIRFDLRELLADGYRPSGPPHVESLPADDITRDGRYDAWVRAGASHQGAE